MRKTALNTPAEPRDFSWALRCIKSGHRLRRPGWEAFGMYIELNHGFENKNLDDYEIRPFLLVRMPDDTYVPWVPMQTDVLAEDWELV